MGDECSKFGKVVRLKVPRPSGGSRQSAGVGKIFVKFDNADSATKALKALAGRKFSDRTVIATYFPEVCEVLLCCTLRTLVSLRTFVSLQSLLIHP